MGRLDQPSPSPAGWRPAIWGTFATSQGHLSRTEHWFSDDGSFAVAREVGTRFVVMTTAEKQAGDLLVISDTNDPTKAGQEHVVARTPSYSCGELAQGAFLPRAGGGYWLATSSGCYLALDESLRRADPLGVHEHLLRRGSLGMDWNERWNVWLLWLVLFGLPLGVIAAIGIDRLLGRIRGTATGTTSRARAITVSAGLFVVAGGYALARILPLLG